MESLKKQVKLQREMFGYKPSMRDKVPQFFKDEGNYSTILTDDMDSLLGCSLVKEINDWDVNQFYNFKGIYTLDPSNTKELVGIDMAKCSGKTIDNHLMVFDEFTRINPESINLNHVKNITNKSYIFKYPFSTFMLILWLHDVPLNHMDDETIKFILTVDSSFGTYYDKNEFMRNKHKRWLEEMNFTRFIDVLNKSSLRELRELQGKTHKIGDEITVNPNGTLSFGGWNEKRLDNLSKRLGFKVELPKGEFTLERECEVKPFVSSPDNNTFMLDEGVMTYNYLYKDKGVVSKLK